MFGALFSLLCVCVFAAVPLLKGEQQGPGQHDVSLLGRPVFFFLDQYLSLCISPPRRPHPSTAHWLDFGLFMVSLWINKTPTINGPKLSLYSPSSRLASPACGGSFSPRKNFLVLVVSLVFLKYLKLCSVTNTPSHK